jgi:glutamate carboxypeptidase
MTLLDHARAERSAFLETLRDLVRLESLSSDKAANDRLAAHLADLLAADGWQVEVLPQTEVGDQVLARLDAPGDTRTLILCHFDTVWPAGTLQEMPLREDGDRLYGPGIFDMKAGVAMSVHAARLARASGRALRGPVTLFLTSDEEIGSHLSRDRIETLAREHDRVLVLEPGREDGAIKIGRKGVGGYRVRFGGVSAHAGNNPQDGASALRELAHFLLYAETLTDYGAGTTVNVTVGRGGSVSNVIAETASCELDVRVMQQAEGERVDAALTGYAPQDARVRVTVAGGINRPPLEYTPANQALHREFEATMAELGLHLDAAVVGGGSDGNFTSAIGVPTLDGLGAAGEGPHARHEHIRIGETLERLALLTAFLTEKQD